MKFAAALVATLLCSLDSADACEPLPRCTDHCTTADALIEATIVGFDDTARTFTVDVTAVFGAGIGLGPATFALDFIDDGLVGDEPAGTTVILEVGTFGGDTLRAVQRHPEIEAGGDPEPCFRAGITLEEYAAIALDPGCDARAELDKLAVPDQPCGGDGGCTSSPSGASLALVGIAIALAGRPRR